MQAKQKNSEFLEIEDIKNGLEAWLEIPITEQEKAEFIAELDPNGTGNVDFETFKALYNAP